jgi:hypothetical protein
MNPRGLSTKTANLNSPSFILFAIQRKTAKFLQKIKPHLVTQFPVCLRVFPFSEPPFENFSQKFPPNPDQKSQIPPIPHGPIY